MVQFAGPDAANFLQGYLTCDTTKLTDQQAQPGAFTNLKGRVVANGWVWGNATNVQMLISVELTQAVAEFLKMYLNFAKTNLSVAPFAPEVALAESTQEDINLGAGKTLRSTGFTAPADSAEQQDLSLAWLDHTISQREVLITTATSATLLPQMLGLTDLGAVSFDKGCYLGQEVVARAQHRGEVKRRLRHIEFSAEQAIPAGASLDDDNGKRVAIVINASSQQALIVTAVDELAGMRWNVAGTPVQLA